MNSRLYSSAFVAGLFYTCVQSSPTPAVPLKPADALTLDVHAFPQITRTPSEQLRQTVWSTLPWVAFWGLFRVWVSSQELKKRAALSYSYGVGLHITTTVALIWISMKAIQTLFTAVVGLETLILPSY